MWLVLGISGVTCGGKSTLAASLYSFFKENQNKNIFGTNSILDDVFLISQDNYFLPITDSRHKWIEQLNHINWEILTALDMEKMIFDIQKILKNDFKLYKKSNDDIKDVSMYQEKINILIIEGFLIFNQPQILKLCQLKFHLHLPYEKCFERRKSRVYDPADVIGYFEMCVWPTYENYYRNICEPRYGGQKRSNCECDIKILNGEVSKENILKYTLHCVENYL